jgi:hypothetical protein
MMNHPVQEQIVSSLGELVEEIASFPRACLDFLDARGAVMVLLGVIALGLGVFVGLHILEQGVDALGDPLLFSSGAVSFLAWLVCSVLFVSRDEDD